MLLDVGLLDLGGGGEAGAQRMAAEREPPLALGKVAAQAGGERACLDEPDDVLVGQPLPRNPAVLARDRPEQGTMADAAEPQPGFEEGDRAGVGARAAADFDVAPAGLAADGQEGAFGEDFDPAGAVFGLAGPAIEPDDFRAAQAAGEADRQDRPVAQAPSSPCPASPAWPAVRRRRSRLSARGGRACRRRMPASTVAIWRSRMSSGSPSCR